MNESITSKKTRCEAITEVISSVANEQNSLASILSVEADKIKTIISTSKETDDILLVNKSVDKMISSITKLEIILSSKLELFQDCLCSSCEDIKPGYSVISMIVETDTGGRIERDDDLKTFRYYPGTTGTNIKMICEPTTTITQVGELPSGLTFKGDKLIIPNGYNWTQTFNMKFLVGEGDTSYEITVLNII